MLSKGHDAQAHADLLSALAWADVSDVAHLPPYIRGLVNEVITHGEILSIRLQRIFAQPDPETYSVKLGIEHLRSSLGALGRALDDPLPEQA